MTRKQSSTLRALGLRWRLIAPGQFLLFLFGHEAIVSSFDEALAFAANFYGRL